MGVATPVSIVLLGFFLGMRHATDPDHVIAGTTIVARQRRVGAAALIGVLSGLLVVGIGASLVRSRLAAAVGEHAGGHHHHDHGDGHGHSHLTPDALGWRSLFALGVSGGLLPCPSALVVMLAAISLGRIGFGLVLIVAFSAGLAGVLGAIGLVFVYARSWFARLPVDGRFARYVPVASALVISAAGLLIVANALSQMGLLGAGL